MAAAGVLLGTTSSQAQLTQLVGITNSIWSYSIDNSDQYANGFPNADDSTWPTSRGLFGNETGYRYPNIVTVPGSSGGVQSSYYKTRFDWSGPATGVVLTMTNAIDDGIVIYLNNVEITRWNVTATPVVHLTQAPVANPLGDNNNWVVHQVILDALTNGAANPLVAGQNVLAVSVHQAGTGSSDSEFGLSVHYSRIVAPCSPGITPTTTNATQCTSVTLALVLPGECGVPTPTIEWFHNGTAVPNQTGTTLTLNNVQDADAGTYFARLSNSQGSADSAVATVNVVADTQGPQIVKALGIAGQPTQFLFTFNEPVLPFIPDGGGGEDAFTYRIETTENPPTILTTESAVIQANPAQVLVTTTSGREAGKSYRYVTTQPIQDNCGRAETPEGLTGPILQQAELVVWTDNRPWKYNDSGADQGTAWKETTFDDSTWSSGVQGFGNETAANFPGAPDSQRTPLPAPSTTFITSYFRTHFQVPAGAQNIIFEADVDDGAAVYVNGTEIGRVNIAAGLALTFNTLTPNLYDPDASLYGPPGGIVIPASVLAPSGDNVLAIEVHQNATTSSDVLMICRITAEVPSIVLEPPQIVTPPANVTVSQGHRFSLSVVATGTALQYQWYKGVDLIPGATGSTYTVNSAAADAGGTYRVVVSNPANSVEASATVTVTPVLVAYNHVWKYETNSQDATLGTATPWYAPAFDDSAWHSGPGPFGFENAQGTFPTPIATPFLGGPVSNATTVFLTAYFRTTMTVPATPAGQQLVLTHLIDDGVVFYVNGNVALQYNAPTASPILSYSLTPAQAPDGGEAIRVSSPIALPAGTYTIAAEVHQNSITSSDVVFGAELRFLSGTGPALTITHPTATSVTVNWAANPNYSLYQATNVGGPWTRVANNPQGTYSVANIAPDAARYFQLRYNGN